VAGGVLGLVAATVQWLRGSSSIILLTLMVFCLIGTGIVARDQMLSMSANKRERQMLAEFPTIAELLALAVGAGEGATGALERVCRLSQGQLAAELRQCLADARAGAELVGLEQVLVAPLECPFVPGDRPEREQRSVAEASRRSASAVSGGNSRSATMRSAPRRGGSLAGHRRQESAHVFGRPIALRRAR